MRPIEDKDGLKALSVGAWQRLTSRMSGLKLEPLTTKLASKRSAVEHLASSSLSFLMQHLRSLSRGVFVFRQEEIKISLIPPVLGRSPMRCLSCFYVHPTLSL